VPESEGEKGKRNLPEQTRAGKGGGSTRKGAGKDGAEELKRQGIGSESNENLTEDTLK